MMLYDANCRMDFKDFAVRAQINGLQRLYLFLQIFEQSPFSLCFELTY